MDKLYGFGNALIDVEVLIEDKDLNYLNIPKGNVKGITSKERDKYLNDFKESIKSYQPGGSIANSIFAFSDNSKESCFACTLGKDEFRERFLEGFSDLTQTIVSDSHKDTGTCFIFITPDGERTMASYLGANEDLSNDLINENILDGCKYIIFDSFSVFTQAGFRTLQFALKKAKKMNKTIFFGLSDSEVIKNNKEKVKWILSREIDFVYGNKTEIETLSNFNFQSPKNIICTNGMEGASFNNFKISAPKIKMVNTNGAGDAFIGTFISNLETLNNEDVLEISVNYASKVCETNGPRLKKNATN